MYTKRNELKIFLVDSDLLYLKLYQTHLKNSGYTNVTCFADGDICLQHLPEQPDVIFLDQHMDSRYGLSLLKKIRAYNATTLVVLLSGTASLRTAIKALKIGAHDYIVKGMYDIENIDKLLRSIPENYLVQTA